MKTNWRRTLLAGAFLLGLAGTARAGGYEDLWAGIKAREDGDVQMAINFYSLAIRSGDLSDENLAVALNNRCVAYSEIGELHRALSDCDVAIRNRPDYANAYRNRGYVYELRGDYRRAIDNASRAIRLNPEMAAAYFNRGVALGKLSRTRKAARLAVKDYTNAIELQPNYADAYYNRGQAYEVLGERERALQDFMRSYKLDSRPKDVRAKLRAYGVIE